MHTKSFKITLYLSLAMIAGLLLSSCGAVTGQGSTQLLVTPVTNTTLTSQGHLAPNDYQYLSFVTGGTIAEVLVQKGNLVTAGQVLARLSNSQAIEASLAGAKLELTSAQQAYTDLMRNPEGVHAAAGIALANAKDALIAAQRVWDEVNTSPFQTKLDNAQTLINTRQTDLTTAQDNLNKNLNLAPDDPIRMNLQTVLDTAQTAFNEAVRQRQALLNHQESVNNALVKTQADVNEAQRLYDATQSGPDPDALALVQGRLTNAKAQVTAVQAALDNLVLKAPFSGTVVDTNIKVNEQANPTTWAFLVADFSQWYVETQNLTELNVVKVSVGQTVSMVPDALPDVTLKGKVTEISHMFQLINGDITYQVRILLEGVSSNAEPVPNLRWGMTVQITFNK
jgi:HlyD family secretion protein